MNDEPYIDYSFSNQVIAGLAKALEKYTPPHTYNKTHQTCYQLQHTNDNEFRIEAPDGITTTFQLKLVKPSFSRVGVIVTTTDFEMTRLVAHIRHLDHPRLKDSSGNPLPNKDIRNTCGNFANRLKETIDRNYLQRLIERTPNATLLKNDEYKRILFWQMSVKGCLLDLSAALIPNPAQPTATYLELKLGTHATNVPLGLKILTACTFDEELKKICNEEIKKRQKQMDIDALNYYLTSKNLKHLSFAKQFSDSEELEVAIATVSGSLKLGLDSQGGFCITPQFNRKLSLNNGLGESIYNLEKLLANKTMEDIHKEIAQEKTALISGKEAQPMEAHVELS